MPPSPRWCLGLLPSGGGGTCGVSLGGSRCTRVYNTLLKHGSATRATRLAIDAGRFPSPPDLSRVAPVVWTKSANIGLCWPDFVQHLGDADELFRPRSERFRAKLGRLPPHSGVARFGLVSTNFERFRPKLAQIQRFQPKLGQPWPDFGHS